MSEKNGTYRTKFMQFFRIVARMFYRQKPGEREEKEEKDIPRNLHIAIMDSITHTYFHFFIFETKQISELTKIPDKYVRMSLNRFRDAKLINHVPKEQIENGEKSYLKEVVDRNFKRHDHEEFWELNRDVRAVVSKRIDFIVKRINEQYENFDSYTKVCTACKREYRPEEYFMSKDSCPECKGQLKDKYQQGVNKENIVPERIAMKQSLEMLQEKMEGLDAEFFMYFLV